MPQVALQDNNELKINGMARFTRLEVIQKMKDTGIIPVFYNSDVELCKKVVKACYDGGIRVFEFTNRGDFATLVFSELHQWAIKECPEMIMGVGSVVDGPTTAMYIALGTNFIVSPLIDEEMARICNKRKISWSPGCGSVTEIGRAHELGCEVVKIFPGSAVGGPGFISALLGPMPYTSIMVTGGVTPDEENLTKWFKAGAFCVGMGSQLFPKEVLASGDLGTVTDTCRKCLSIVQKLK